MESGCEQSPTSQDWVQAARLLACISVDLSLQSLSLPALLVLTEHISNHPFTQENADLVSTMANCLSTIVKKAVSQPEGVSFVYESVMTRALLLCIRPSLLSPLPETHVFMEHSVLENWASLLRVFSQAAGNDRG